MDINIFAKSYLSGTTAMSQKTRVLFLCVANAARSQMAEALLRHTDPEGYEAFSAGTQPGGRALDDAVQQSLDLRHLVGVGRCANELFHARGAGGTAIMLRCWSNTCVKPCSARPSSTSNCSREKA